MEHRKGSVGRDGAVIYTTISLLAALAFWAIATATGGYSSVAIYGGATWVFLLTLIVSMPLVIAAVKRRDNP
ncbi:MAG: hypothetical protein ACYC4L_22260 [Chloroflexota bacterium]